MKEIKTLNHKTAILLEKIDSKEIAYLVGFACADSAINNSIVEYSVKLEDKEIVEFISRILLTKINIDNTFDKKARRFPRARFSRKLVDILNFIKSEKKENRILPIINSSLNKYLIQGFFDGDGCITWGKRKDRNRIWQKVSFTSTFKMLLHTQTILQKEIKISSSIKPKKGENTFVLEICSKEDVLKFFDWLYDPEFVILKRKFQNFQALRLELDKFGGTTLNSTIPSQANNHLLEGLETSGEKLVSLNNHNNIQAYK